LREEKDRLFLRSTEVRVIVWRTEARVITRPTKVRVIIWRPKRHGFGRGRRLSHRCFGLLDGRLFLRDGGLLLYGRGFFLDSWGLFLRRGGLLGFHRRRLAL